MGALEFGTSGTMAQSRLKFKWSNCGVFAVIAALAGCSDGSEQVVHVRGTVTYQGKPLPMGMIVFEPDTSRGNSGPQGHANIVNGQFDTKQSKKGALAGPLIVRITGGDGVNAEAFTPFGNLLFEEYSTHIDLKRDQTDLTFDVPKSRRPPDHGSAR